MLRVGLVFLEVKVTRPFFRFALPFVLLVFVWGCGEKGARLQKSVVPPDKTLFETGAEYLKKSQFIKARLAFQTLISTYPDSDVVAEAYLSMGDSFYNEGGTENLLQAEDRYHDFIVFFPMHPKAADAQMKIISLNMKMMHSPDRDQQYTVKADREIKKFLEQFPDSDYTPLVRGWQTEVEENLALADYGVGSFYQEKGNFLGAQSRYKEIIDSYGSFSMRDEVLFRLAQSLERMNDKEGAAGYLAQIAQGFPFSRHFEEAKNELKLLGKPVPQVDSQLAAVNQSHLKQAQGFSPLKPFIDFVGALGLKPPPDRYQSAKRAIETQRAEAASAQAASAKAGAGDKASEDALIQAKIEKDASGKTQVSVVGGNTTANATAADKNGDNKKKVDNSKKKKTDVKKPPSP